MMKTKTLTYSDYDKLEKAIKGLGWIWRCYQQEMPNGWYEFKYQGIVSRFLENELEEQLLVQAQHRRFPRCVKVPKQAYQEMKELAAIFFELEDVLAHPPFGSQILPAPPK